MPDLAPIVILDTNALLDWRVFKDPAAQPIVQGILAREGSEEGGIEGIQFGRQKRDHRFLGTNGRVRTANARLLVT